MLPWYTHLGIKFTLAPFSILGVAIAIFLGFRNNAGYARYVEARKLWGQLMIASRSLLREVKTTLPDSASVREFARLQIAFAHCLRMTLRKQPQAEVLAHYLKTEDLQRVLASNSPANRILLIMGEWLAVQRRNGQLSDILFISLNDRLNDISAVLAGCERIAYTPIEENDFRISVAGAQEKTALLRIGNDWCIPKGITPTTHIIKLPIGEMF